MAKKLKYQPKCKKDLEKFPPNVRDGFVLMLRSACREQSDVLDRLYNENSISGFKTNNLSNLYRNTWEIKKQDGQHFFRLAYSNYRECVFALHAFLKKTNKTERRDHDTIQERAKRAAESYRQGDCD